MLSGLAASLAAIVYVAHLGQARSDAGTGYELDAIAAVVLGGTSVFGGRGTLWGTLLGLLSLSVLRNGVQLAALPSELTGVLTGVLLVTTIAIDRWRGLDAAAPPPIFGGPRREKQPSGHALRRDHRAGIARGRHQRLARAIAAVRRAGRDGGPRRPPAHRRRRLAANGWSSR